MKKIAQVAIIKPLHNLFDYEIPEEFGNIEPGMRVSVEFGRKLVLGFVVKVKKYDNSLGYKLKKISAVVDKKPSLDAETLNLLIWVSNYYHAPLGQVIGLGTPLYLRQGKDLPNDISNNIKQKENFLKDKILMTREQSDAIEIIEKSINSFECFLLDGITGSGKTEVYKNIQEQIYKNNLQTLIIVPEKNLIPELLKYFDSSDMTVLEYHSSLTPKQKFTNWNLIQQCNADIIIGTRSSVFLKIPELGLIVVDEEHDVSFKNGSETKYNARDIAIFRAKNKNIPIILGSATPSSETILNVNTKAVFNIAQLCANQIIKLKRKNASIINISSIFGLVAGQKRTVYSMTKFGVEGLTKGMALDLAKYNIRVNSVCPNIVLTPRTKKYFDDKIYNKYVRESTPIKKVVTISDVATTITFLASEASSMITGASIVIDGGWTSK